MGNDFVKPSSKSILNPVLFEEYTYANLNDVKESSDFLGKNTDFLDKVQFENAFSALFKDPDPHFAIFEKTAIGAQLQGSSSQLDDGQVDSTVNPFVVCTLIALLSKDSVDKKFTYIHDLHFNNDNQAEVSYTAHFSNNVNKYHIV
jgi:hypothetical protein